MGHRETNNSFYVHKSPQNRAQVMELTLTIPLQVQHCLGMQQHEAQVGTETFMILMVGDVKGKKFNTSPLDEQCNEGN